MNKENLKRAIELAKGPGQCRYLDTADEPQCVVAQLAVLEGINLKQIIKDESLRRTQRLDECDDEVAPANKASLFTIDALVEEFGNRGYSITLLTALQDAWDTSSILDVEAIRLKMRQIAGV